MSYVPTDEDLSKYEERESSSGHRFLDYEQGLGAQLAQSGAMGGYHLANLPSYAYEVITGKPLYHTPKPQLSDFIPESEAGQIGGHVGEIPGDILSLYAPGRFGLKALKALSRYHPFTKGQIGRQFQHSLESMEKAGLKNPLSYKQLQELNELLSHPALKEGGRAGRALTPQGIGSIIEEGAQGAVPARHSAQSLLGDLERVLPGSGESILANTRVRPLKEQILESLIKGARDEGLEEEANAYQKAREGARRYHKTRKTIKKVIKPLSIGALIKAGISGAKNLP